VNIFTNSFPFRQTACQKRDHALLGSNFSDNRPRLKEKKVPTAWKGNQPPECTVNFLLFLIVVSPNYSILLG